MTPNEITFCYNSNAIVIQRSIFILNILLALIITEGSEIQIFTET